MKTYTPVDYLKIELGNQQGHDKISYAERIKWVNTQFNPNDLANAESPNQATRCYLELLEVLENRPSNYCISLDATASVLQLISVLMKCRKTAHISNVIGDTRNDPYKIVHNATGLAEVPRKKCKEAIMTSCYGSTYIPKQLYVDNLEVFYKAMEEEAPAAMAYVSFTQKLWNPKALYHTWTLPDNFNVVLPTEVKKVEVVSFRGNNIKVEYTEEGTKKFSRELSASIIHSIDSFVVRELTARCGHSLLTIREDKELETKLDQLAEQTGFKSARILYLNPARKSEFVLPERSFRVISTHDCFKVNYQYGNELRATYNQILYELANSKLLDYIVSELTNKPTVIPKPTESTDWFNEILEANYSLT